MKCGQNNILNECDQRLLSESTPYNQGGFRLGYSMLSIISTNYNYISQDAMLLSHRKSLMKGLINLGKLF